MIFTLLPLGNLSQLTDSEGMNEATGFETTRASVQAMALREAWRPATQIGHWSHTCRGQEGKVAVTA